MFRYIFMAVNYLALLLGLAVIYALVLDKVGSRDISVSLINHARDFIGKPRLQVASSPCVNQPINGSTFVFDYPALHSDSKMVQLELSNQVRDKRAGPGKLDSAISGFLA